MNQNLEDINFQDNSQNEDSTRVATKGGAQISQARSPLECPKFTILL